MPSNPIPQSMSGIPRAIQSVLAPVRDVLQRAFFSRGNERCVTRADLVKLDLVTQAQINDLED